MYLLHPAQRDQMKNGDEVANYNPVYEVRLTWNGQCTKHWKSETEEEDAGDNENEMLVFNVLRGWGWNGEIDDFSGQCRDLLS